MKRIFDEAFGSEKVMAVSKAAIEGWLKDNSDKSPRTRIHYKVKLSEF